MTHGTSHSLERSAHHGVAKNPLQHSPCRYTHHTTSSTLQAHVTCTAIQASITSIISHHTCSGWLQGSLRGPPSGWQQTRRWCSISGLETGPSPAGCSAVQQGCCQMAPLLGPCQQPAACPSCRASSGSMAPATPSCSASLMLSWCLLPPHRCALPQHVSSAYKPPGNAACLGSHGKLRHNN